MSDNGTTLFLAETVAQIHTFALKYQPLAPFYTEGTVPKYGTGFFIGPTLVMTAAHVVSEAFPESGIKLTLPKVDQNQEFSTRLLTLIPEIDIALLEVTDPTFTPRRQVFQLGDVQTLGWGQQLWVVGYPLGERIKITQSTFNGFQNGMIQFDSSINPGSSGGPVVKKDDPYKVIGVVSSGYNPRRANNVFFAVPINFYSATLPWQPDQAGAASRVLALPSLGLLYHNGTSLGPSAGSSCQEGVRVQWVSRQSALYGVLKPGDRLCTLTHATVDYPIDNGGDVKVPWIESSKVPLFFVLSLTPVNAPIRLRYQTHATGQLQEVTTVLKPAQSGLFQTIHYPLEPLEFEPYGGVIVMPLRRNHLESFPFLAFQLTPEEKEGDWLVVSHLVPNSLAYQSGVLEKGQLLDRVNGRQVRTLADYRHALATPLTVQQESVVQWVTKDQALLELPWSKVQKEAPQLQREQGVPVSSVYASAPPTTTLP